MGQAGNEISVVQSGGFWNKDVDVDGVREVASPLHKSKRLNPDYRHSPEQADSLVRSVFASQTPLSHLKSTNHFNFSYIHIS
jgi:hypothetical protein